MDIDGIAGTLFVIAGLIVFITSIIFEGTLEEKRMAFIFAFIILSAGLILLGISRVLDKLSDIEKKIGK